jgi:cytochrome bd-type quinol oxidase subunit 2
MIAFDYGRTHNQPARLGSATSIINIGGFVAALVTILAIGLVLQYVPSAGSPEYTMHGFRLAFSVQYAVWMAGISLFLPNIALCEAASSRAILNSKLRKAVATNE